MTSRSSFTIEEARRNRISGDTRTGYASGINQVIIWIKLVNKLHLLKQSADGTAGESLDLSQFQYLDFLDFLVWTVRNKPTIKPGTLSGYRSAIKSLYRDESLAVPIEFGDDMKEIFSGLRKTIAQDLQSGRLQDSGKRPLSWSTFERLCYDSMLLSDGGFTHLFLIVTWNLMCRSQSTETIR
ncbi:hypothetical protein H257_16085 [Aphanomyces astaci]|uniref:Core-binding (CB) domain-containing protein n=1 Tax=Aphanomyces astaci TaxID=112090 RepID=W4FLN2_APHAT|nr:hypothetical protein H257_16085 [Aphanomyces astaci]ETV67724.1 hypothetical protein H257_16085 [Aphanomyces astaci]|eukprot:XP_009842717.1 hypothetical protein H257_16085 [Aphanomyces astaci]